MTRMFDWTAPASLRHGARWSVLAAGSCAAIPFLTTILPELTASRAVLLFAGAAAFASTLTGPLPPVIRGAAALVQAVCAFEILGLAAGLTVLALTNPSTMPSLPWWGVVAAWSAVCACFRAAAVSTWHVLHDCASVNPE